MSNLVHALMGNFTPPAFVLYMKSRFDYIMDNLGTSQSATAKARVLSMQTRLVGSWSSCTSP